MIGYPLDRAKAILAAEGASVSVAVVSRGDRSSEGTLRVVKQDGARLFVAAFRDGAPARKETP